MSLVEQSDLKLEIVVNPDNRLIRFYRKFWDKNGPITFCRLFWATVASPFMAVGMVTLSPIWVPLAGVAKLRNNAVNRRIAKPNEPPEPSKPPKVKKEKRRIKFLDWLGKIASKAILGIQSWTENHKTGLLRTRDIVGIVAAIGLGLGVAALVVSGLFTIGAALIAASTFFWYIMMMVAISLIGAVIALGALFLIGRFAHRRKYDRALGYAVSRPAIGAWTLFKLGYRAVKTNTCPRITVSDD